jgi:glycogen debranching enzyme
MVWTWLIGPYLDAARKVYANPTSLPPFLQGLKAHLTDAGVGTISEIFDGEFPHRPRGCVAQAWSVAEILRHLA